MSFITTRLFTWRQILVYTAIFLTSVVVLQRALRFTCADWIRFDCPDYWPVSIFSPRLPSVRDVIVALAVMLVFFVLAKFLETRKYNIWLTAVSGAIVIAGLSSIHGLDVGYYAPIAGDAQTGILVPYSLNGQEYYHDALTVADPVYFLAHYNEIQPTLHRHAHTHPPGAVLTFYFLQRTVKDPALIALMIMLVSIFGTGYFSYRIMRTEFLEGTSGYMAFLLMLLPAIQIYYLATIDALITTLLIATLYLFCFGKSSRALVGAVAMLCVSFLLTFVSLFILPVLVGFDLIVKKSLRRSVITIGVLGSFYVILYLLTGYNAFQAFRTASAFENPQGFMLFTDPVNYLFTRFEDLAEIIFFLGPFLLFLFIRGIRSIKLRPLDVLTALACITLLGMFVSGAWRTGETARACAFIYPFLFFPVGRYLEDKGSGSGERIQLASLVFLQSLGMQVFGNYFW
jgi:hypothetical protein